MASIISIPPTSLVVLEAGSTTPVTSPDGVDTLIVQWPGQIKHGSVFLCNSTQIGSQNLLLQTATVTQPVLFQQTSMLSHQTLRLPRSFRGCSKAE